MDYPGVAVERKELNDLIGCLTVGRDRFERELERSRSLDYFAVVAECSMEDIARHRYTSAAKPHAMLMSILALQMRYKAPFIFAGNRAGGEYTTYHLLRMFAREQGK